MTSSPTGCAAAIAHFRAKLRFETDPSDVAAAMATAEPGFVLIDSRGRAAWEQGHLPGALHLPTAEIADRAPVELPPPVRVVTYCWGPGCNGSTRAALAFSELGYPAVEMIGGYEYWVREGLPVQTAAGAARQPADPLTAVSALDCGCQPAGRIRNTG
jgi:rhodanese-related sulfurtransferase